jgi:hypothetical protein
MTVRANPCGKDKASDILVGRTRIWHYCDKSEFMDLSASRDRCIILQSTLLQLDGRGAS